MYGLSAEQSFAPNKEQTKNHETKSHVDEVYAHMAEYEYEIKVEPLADWITELKKG